MTVRTATYLNTSAFQDGQGEGDISEQDFRDLVDSSIPTVNIMAYANGVAINTTVGDASAALTSAIADLPIYGGRVIIPPGRYQWFSEVVITKPVVIEGVGPRYGATFSPNSNEKGSYLTLSGAIGGAMIRFALPVSGTASWGSGVKNLAFLGNGRAFSCGSALHVESANQICLDSLDFEQVKGRALRISATIKSDINRINIDQSGDTGLPSFDLDPSGGNFVQGSSFSQFKIEVSYGVYFSATANVQTNKFDDFGFEADGTNALTLNKMLTLAGQRNQIGKMHFNRLDSTATVAKVEVTGDHNEFSNLLFAGQKSSTATAGDLFVSGSFNQFGVVKFWGLQTFTETIKTLVATGAGNSFAQIKSTFDGGWTLSGDYNTIGDFSSFSGGGQYLVSGAYCDVGLLKVQGSTYSGDLVLLSGTRPNALVRIITAANATSGVKISSSGKLLPGSFIQNVTNGHGVWFTNNLGAADGVIINICGKHGFFIDECEPRQIANCEVRDAGALTASTWDAYSFNSASTNRNSGIVFCGNAAIMTTSTHRWAFFITDNAGTPRFGNMTITGFNHAGGGATSFSVGTNINVGERT